MISWKVRQQPVLKHMAAYQLNTVCWYWSTACTETVAAQAYQAGPQQRCTTAVRRRKHTRLCEAGVCSYAGSTQ